MLVIRSSPDEDHDAGQYQRLNSQNRRPDTEQNGNRKSGKYHERGKALGPGPDRAMVTPIADMWPVNRVVDQPAVPPVRAVTEAKRGQNHEWHCWQ